jgi:hypothetical protein
VYQDDGKLLVKVRGEKMSKSARFAEGVLMSSATQSSSLLEGWAWTGFLFRFYSQWIIGPVCMSECSFLFALCLRAYLYIFLANRLKLFVQIDLCIRYDTTYI